MSNANPQEMTLLERLKAAQGAPPAQPQAPAPQAAPPAPSYPTPVPNAAGDMSAFATRNAEGRVICDLRGRPLSPDTIAKQYVQDPHTRGWLPIVPLIAKVAQLLEADADSFAATQVPVIAQALATPQPPPAWTPPGAAAPPAFQPPAQTGPINPPEWQPPTAAHAPPQAPAAAPAFTFQAPQAAAPQAQAPAAETGKRKRATKAEMEARRAAAANGVSAAPAPQAQAPMPWQPPAANAAPLEAPSTDGDSDASPIAILAINVSIPRGFEDYDQIVLDDLMPDVHASIKRDLQVDDYSLLDYGKGTGALSLYVAQAVKVACEAAGNVPVILHVDSRTREGSIVLSRLVAMASSVIRGA